MIEYPWALHKAGGLTKTVQTADEKKAALADGWQVDPPDQQPPNVAPEPEPDPEPEPTKRRRGRE